MTAPLNKLLQSFTLVGSSNQYSLSIGISSYSTIFESLLSLISLKKDSVFNALFVLSIITAVISLMPLMYGLNNYSLVGALITIALVTESIFVKAQQK